MLLLPELQSLPHGVAIIGNRHENQRLLRAYLEKNKIPVSGNPDIFIYDNESLKIDTLRDEILPFLNNQKVSEHRFLIISVDQVGFEVQNAFLKNLEEPHVGTYIIFLIENTDKLLATIHSRVWVITGDTTSGETRLETPVFLSQDLSGRFSYIESWTKNKKDEDNVSKAEISYFINQLEKKLWESGNRDAVLFADIRKMRDYVGIRGASHRIILDFLAMICPIIK